MRVKICGITREEDALAAAWHGADFVGFILADSPRRVTVEQARQLVRAVGAATQPVLVFRDAPRAAVVAASDKAGCGWVQLHGLESVEYVQELLDARPELRVIRAWSVASAADQRGLEAYLREAADAGVAPEILLLDAPKGGAHPGYACLAELSRSVRPRPREIWCAGGLTADNLVAAVADGRFDGVDVAGGVEANVRIKDPTAVERFIVGARALAH